MNSKEKTKPAQPAETIEAFIPPAKTVGEVIAGHTKDELPSHAAQEWRPGDVLLEDFQVERVLGRGGMGVVYLVRSLSSQRAFALKTVLTERLGDPKNQRSFFEELTTWIDLPPHTHLAACYFFRTIDGQIAIFAEFVEGGSLRSWILERRLTRLEQLLDVAIQFAWGLHAAHQAGLVHQDVKPDNALITLDGVVKVSDFGLAKAMQPSVGDDLLVSFSGMTPAYCSPEQASREQLSHKTDIWSWGLSVLEMFTGEISWHSGLLAAEALESFLEQPTEPDLPLMPHSVAEVLRRCFHRDPKKRWDTLVQAADALRESYFKELGTSYPRQLTTISKVQRQPPAQEDRVTPLTWLREALSADGREPSLAETRIPSRSHSPRAQAIADIALYEEARSILERQFARGQFALEERLAALYSDKAAAHDEAEDLPGAIALYEKAAYVYEKLFAAGRTDLTEALARTQGNRGKVLLELGEPAAAVACFDRTITLGALREQGVFARHSLAQAHSSRGVALRAMGQLKESAESFDPSISILQSLMPQRPDEPLNARFIGSLATAYLGKGGTLKALGKYKEAAALCERGIRLFESIIGKGFPQFRPGLSDAYMDHAGILRAQGEYRAAVSFFDKAIELKEQLVLREELRKLAGGLTTAYFNKTLTLRALGEYQGALVLSQRAVEICERLVFQEGRRELSQELASAYRSQSDDLWALGDTSAALALLDKTLHLYERLVFKEERAEHTHSLALTYTKKAERLIPSRDRVAVLDLYQKGIELLERLLQGGQRKLAGELAGAYRGRANATADLGDHRGSLPLYDQTSSLYERLVRQEGRRDLLGDWAHGYRAKALTLCDLNEQRSAIPLFDKAIQLFEEEQSEDVEPQALSHLNKASALQKLAEHRASLEPLARAIALYLDLIERKGRNSLSDALAYSYLMKARALVNLAEKKAAVSCYEQASLIYERVVLSEKRYRFAPPLAAAHTELVGVLSSLGSNDTEAAAARAVEILAQLVHQEGQQALSGELVRILQRYGAILSQRGEHSEAIEAFNWAIEEGLGLVVGAFEIRGPLAAAHAGKAAALREIGQLQASALAYDSAIELLEKLVIKETRHQLASALADAYQEKAKTLTLLGDQAGARTLQRKADGIQRFFALPKR